MKQMRERLMSRHQEEEAGKNLPVREITKSNVIKEETVQALSQYASAGYRALKSRNS